MSSLGVAFSLSSLMIVEMRSHLAQMPYVEGWLGFFSGVLARRYNRSNDLRNWVVVTKCSDLAERFEFVTEKGSLLR